MKKSIRLIIVTLLLTVCSGCCFMEGDHQGDGGHGGGEHMGGDREGHGSHH
jgi:hypothetical protein